MHVQCPHCNATIHLEAPQDAPQLVKCWMCTSTIDALPSDAGPKTIRVPSPNLRESPAPIGLESSGFTEAVSTELSSADRVRLDIVFGFAQGTEFEITKSLTSIGRKGGPISKWMIRRSLDCIARLR